jgi:transcriptional regulator with XRE-family HTH domain
MRPVPRKPPTVRLRRLAGELKRLRLAAGLSQEAVADQTGLDKSSMYRIERALNKPQRRTVMTLLELYGVGDERQRTALLNLLKDASKQNWFRVYEEMQETYQTYISFEAEASRLSNFEPMLVPGLLQTEDYARAVIGGVEPTLTNDAVEQRVEVRMRRQQILRQPDPTSLWAIIDEAVLHRLVGGDSVMHSQLGHLLDAAGEPHITIQVVPFEAGAYPGLPGGFVLLEFPEPTDLALVYTDGIAGEVILEQESEVLRRRTRFQQLVAQALSPDETRKMLSRLAVAGR